MPHVLRSSLLLFGVTSAGLAASWLINARTLESVRPVPAVETVAFLPAPLPGRFEKDDVLPAAAAAAHLKPEHA
ncbi:hypothetical protein, partial [Rhizobium leguminosarum]|uniref:hypothetical protein n=1 Tax=Rhizobium leguminosarum TaxID=384 RepID=UPI001C969559